MRGKLRGFMRTFKFALAVTATVALCGCASMVVPDDSSRAYSLLEDALTVPVPVLEEKAAANDGRAQYSLSLIYRHGFHGVERDIAKANELKQKALLRRGYHTITQYIPGIDGKPGRTALINTPRYDVSRSEAEMVEKCINVNNSRTPLACGPVVKESVSYRRVPEFVGEVVNVSSLTDLEYIRENYKDRLISYYAYSEINGIVPIHNPIICFNGEPDLVIIDFSYVTPDELQLIAAKIEEINIYVYNEYYVHSKYNCNIYK